MAYGIIGPLFDAGYIEGARYVLDAVRQGTPLATIESALTAESLHDRARKNQKALVQERTWAIAKGIIKPNPSN